MITPGMKGDRVYENLVKLKPSIKIIISSGFSSRDDYEKYKKMDNCELVSKPFEIKTLLAKLASLINQGDLKK